MMSVGQTMLTPLAKNAQIQVQNVPNKPMHVQDDSIDADDRQASTTYNVDTLREYDSGCTVRHLVTGLT